MKKLVCLLIALMLCVSCACAESAAVGGMMLNIPAQWRIKKTVQAGDGYYLELSYLTDAPVHTINMSHTQLENWDSIAAVEDGLIHFANLSAITLLSELEMENAQTQTEKHMALRDGGHALKLVYKTADKNTTGILIILSGGAMVTALAASEDGAQCESWLDQMLLPLRVQEEIEVGGLPVGLPAGFVKNDENGMYFSENNEAIKVFSLDANSESVQKLIAERSTAEVLLLLLQSQIGDLQYSNMQMDSLERGRLSALIGSMDITANGNSGCMGTLTALYDGQLVGVSYIGSYDQQAAAEMLQMITYPLQAQRGFYVGDIALAYPEGFINAEYENKDEIISAVINDQMAPEMTVAATPLTEEEQQMDVKTLLSQKIKEELSDVTGSDVKPQMVEYDGATAMHITWYDEAYGVKYANGIVFAANSENLIRIYMSWPEADTEQVSAVFADVMPSPAGGETIAQGNVTLNIPRGWNFQENVEEDGSIKYTAANNNGWMTTYYWSAMPDNLRGMIEGMDVQTALEIQLSMLANEIGVEGITIDYAQNESGVHMVTSTFMHPQYAIGAAFLIDGDACWVIEIDSSVNEEEARVLLDSVLEQVR